MGKEFDNENKVGWCLIPPDILVRDDINNSQKILYGRVKALMKKEGYCYASNEYLGNNLDLSANTISNYISDLADKNLLSRELIKGEDSEVKERRLYPSPQINGDLPTNNKGGPPHNNVEGSGRGSKGGENRDIDNSDEEKKEKLREVFDHWVRQESTISHRKFSDAFKSAINARLDDGFTVDEIKEAISNYDKANRAKNSYWNYDAWSLKQFLSRDSGGHVETFLEKPKTYIEDDSGEFKFGGDEEGRKTKVKDGVEYIYTNEWGWVPKEEDKDD